MIIPYSDLPRTQCVPSLHLPSRGLGHRRSAFGGPPGLAGSSNCLIIDKLRKLRWVYLWFWSLKSSILHTIQLLAFFCIECDPSCRFDLHKIFSDYLSPSVISVPLSHHLWSINPFQRIHLLYSSLQLTELLHSDNHLLVLKYLQIIDMTPLVFRVCSITQYWFIKITNILLLYTPNRCKI